MLSEYLIKFKTSLQDELNSYGNNSSETANLYKGVTRSQKAQKLQAMNEDAIRQGRINQLQNAIKEIDTKTNNDNLKVLPPCIVGLDFGDGDTEEIILMNNPIGMDDYGYTVIGSESPLGAALIDTETGSKVRWKASKSEIYIQAAVSYIR